MSPHLELGGPLAMSTCSQQATAKPARAGNHGRHRRWESAPSSAAPDMAQAPRLPREDDGDPSPVMLGSELRGGRTAEMPSAPR